MFTVVIAEQTHISAIAEYRMFLRPFLDESQVAFCSWNTQGNTLDEILPELGRTVAQKASWRALVLLGQEGYPSRNPFDRIDYVHPAQGKHESDGEYAQRLWEARSVAFEEAARQPLTKLMTFLNQLPMERGDLPKDALQEEEDDGFALYREARQESLYKHQLRKAILEGHKQEFALPGEILCVALRTCPVSSENIRDAWEPHVDHQYTRFYDWNLYFDKMRYLVFDLVPKSHQRYTFDYIRFLYTLLLLTNHPIPQGCLRPHRLYNLDCENDETALQELFARYDAKLLATDERLAQRIHNLRTEVKPRLTDQEAQSIFCGKVTVPVTVAREFDRSSLFVSPEDLGLSTDCPADELSTWQHEYAGTQKALNQYLKYARRGLTRAASDVKNLNTMDTDRVRDLNTFQLEDVTEHVTNEELAMVRTQTIDLEDPSFYTKESMEAARQVEKKIGQRMSRKATLAVGISCLAVFLIGCLPMLLMGFSQAKTLPLRLMMMVGALALLAGVSLVCLLALRRSLRKKYSNFNGAMGGVVNQVTQSNEKFSEYLSHACNMMRGYSVLNHYAENDDPSSRLERVMQKHRMDILRCREELRDSVGQYLNDQETYEEDPYLYDFSRPVDYNYPLVYRESQSGLVEFLEPGNTLAVPVSFIKAITVRLEELYEYD